MKRNTLKNRVAAAMRAAAEVRPCSLPPGKLFGVALCPCCVRAARETVERAAGNWLIVRIDADPVLVSDVSLCRDRGCRADHHADARRILRKIRRRLASGRLRPSDFSFTPGWPVALGLFPDPSVRQEQRR